MSAHDSDIEINTEASIRDLASLLRAKRWQMATAESCTGGLIAACCTAVAGSSEWFDRGVVTYSNDAKSELLGVSTDLIHAHGAVSREVACAMAQGLLQRCKAHLVVAVTGIAGPGGATPDKPVGTVWLAWGHRDGKLQAERLQLAGDRRAVRHQTVHEALLRLQDSAG